MTGTGRIRWEPTGYGGWTGHVGTRPETDWLFQIWSAASVGGDWQLDSTLPGHFGQTSRADDPATLKADAEFLLAEFVSSLGATFGEDACEFPHEDDMPLEVRFAAGTRVRFAHPDAGYPGEAEVAMKALTPGRVYTIAWADISQSRTDLNLADRGRALGRLQLGAIRAGSQR